MRSFWISFTIFIVSSVTGILYAQDDSQDSWIIRIPTLTQDSAGKIMAAAGEKAGELTSGVYAPARCKMHVYVLGREGTLLASTQALGAWSGSADIAYRKARTAWMFRSPSGFIGEFSRPDKKARGPAYAIEISNGGLITFPGGLPIFDTSGNCAGSIGVSGDTVDNDEAVAKAGVEKARELGAEGIKYLPSLSQLGALKILDAAMDKAAGTQSDLGNAFTKMHIYVLGREGTVLAATQADGAWPASEDIAYRKARTAWLFKLPTEIIGDLSRMDKEAGAPLYGIELSNNGIISFAGGLPIFDAAGEMVGTIGVSGDSVNKDREVAQAGVDAFDARANQK